MQYSYKPAPALVRVNIKDSNQYMTEALGHKIYGNKSTKAAIDLLSCTSSRALQ